MNFKEKYLKGEIEFEEIDSVKKIIDDVKKNGDEAVKKYTLL